jgi:hypothetical protein
MPLLSFGLADATAAVVRYTWVDGDTDEPGAYDACWVVLVPPSSTPISYPNGSCFVVQITPAV